MISFLIAGLRALRLYWLWLVEVREIAAADDALYAADTADLIAARRQSGSVHPWVRECPLPDCRTCEPAPPLAIQSKAFRLGRDPIEGERIRQVAVWLRENLADYWRDAPEGDLQCLAYWLLDLRERCEDGRVSVR